jgi:hypothetical protein
MAMQRLQLGKRNFRRGAAALLESDLPRSCNVDRFVDFGDADRRTSAGVVFQRVVAILPKMKLGSGFACEFEGGRFFRSRQTSGH